MVKSLVDFGLKLSTYAVIDGNSKIATIPRLSHSREDTGNIHFAPYAVVQGASPPRLHFPSVGIGIGVGVGVM